MLALRANGSLERVLFLSEDVVVLTHAVERLCVVIHQLAQHPARTHAHTHTHTHTHTESTTVSIDIQHLHVVW